MGISKNEFKTIYNHMKTLSNLEANELINQAKQSNTQNEQINQIIQTHSSRKVVKLMGKINQLMYGGSDDNIQIVSNSSSGEQIETNPNQDQEFANIDVDSSKETIKEIIEKLKNKSQLLKTKEAQLIVRENELNEREENIKKLESANTNTTSSISTDTKPVEEIGNLNIPEATETGTDVSVLDKMLN